MGEHGFTVYDMMARGAHSFAQLPALISGGGRRPSGNSSRAWTPSPRGWRPWG